MLFAMGRGSLVEPDLARCGLNGAIFGLESPERLDKGAYK